MLVLSKNYELQLGLSSAEKYKNDDLVYKDKNEQCPLCKEYYKFIAVGGSNPVDRVCRCSAVLLPRAD